MALKAANFAMRMEAQKKAEAEALYEALGLTLPQAVNVFIAQSLLVGGLPFEVRMPKVTAETEAAMREAREIASGAAQAKSYSSVADLFKELDAE